MLNGEVKGPKRINLETGKNEIVRQQNNATIISRVQTTSEIKKYRHVSIYIICDRIQLKN